MDQIELPRYKCHKEVWALKIKSIERGAVTFLTFEEPGYAAKAVGYDYDVKHSPEVGGYYVVYDDGYTSYSPAKAFEDGYALVVPYKSQPSTSDSSIEQEIQAKGLTAPRITPADIEANIDSEHYIPVGSALAAMGHMARYATPLACNLLTICVLVLRNGFTVTGESACASPENFDPQLGRKIARQNAIAKVWPLMGYELRSKLAIGPGSGD